MSSFNSRKIFPIGTAVLAIVAGAVWYLWPSADQIVRKIGVSARPPAEWATPGSVTIFRSSEELRAAFPRAEVQPDRPIDFERECLVRVGWQSAGVLANEPAPGSADSGKVLFGTLQCRARMVGRNIMFYIQEPQQYGTVRSVFQQILGDDWFTVPKNAQVAFVRPLVITLYDGGFLLIAALILGLGFAGAALNRAGTKNRCALESNKV